MRQDLHWGAQRSTGLVGLDKGLVIAGDLKNSEAVGTAAPVAKPALALEPTTIEAVLAENAAPRARLAATNAALGPTPPAAAAPRGASRRRAPRA